MNDAYLRTSIEPDSTQLNADDLMAGPLTVTVLQVKQGPSREQPVEIVIDGHRPFRPCKSMRRVLIACWGDNGQDWVGRSMTLYADPGVKFGGVAVGGIRISHLSDIDEDEKSLLLTTARTKRAPFIVRRLTDLPPSYPEDDFKTNVNAWVSAINGGNLTVPGLIQKVAKKGRLTAKQIKEIERLVNRKTETLPDQMQTD